MSRWQKWILVIGITLIAVSWAFPPWVHRPRNPANAHIIEYPHGYYFVLDMQQREKANYRAFMSFDIDFSRLIVQSGLVLALTLAAFVAARRKNV